jgi:hypothetical protein
VNKIYHFSLRERRTLAESDFYTQAFVVVSVVLMKSSKSEQWYQEVLARFELEKVDDFVRESTG